MASQQANAVLARSRSLRLSAKPALTASQTPAPTAATTTACPPQIPSATSHLLLFLTNLRLLDLDLEPDWPGITPATFSSKDAAGGLKARLHCVEWALYQLFVLWDEDEARNKLKPFYPPLDQVQSINLRAALLRGLEQAKRNGVLGRDAVIRKTMLDECKGERFEEVLAVFSSAVLKKLVAERSLNSGLEYRPTFSEKIALENWGYSGERTELNGLLLAHKASLKSALRSKDAARERYRDFADFLALKERRLARRREQVHEAEKHDTTSQISARLKAEAQQTLRVNWTGNDQWLDILQHGEAASRKDGLLSRPFEDIWKGVQEGKLADIEDQSTGLLEQLDQRVRLQQTRLDKWRDFRKSLFGDRPEESAGQAGDAGTKPRGIDFGFNAHQHLAVGVTPPEALADDKSPPAPGEFSQLLDDMRAELVNIGKPKVPNFFKPSGASRSRPQAESPTALESPTEPMSDLSEWEDELEEKVKAPAKRSATSKPGHSRKQSADDLQPKPSKRGSVTEPKSNQIPSTVQITRTSPEKESPPQRAEPGNPDTDREDRLSNLSDLEHPPPTTPARNDASSLEAKAKGKSGQEPARDTPPLQRPISPTQAMADQILASMSMASPSPVKRQIMSLEERTRMSMKRTKSFDPDEKNMSHLYSPSPLAAHGATGIKKKPAADGESEQVDDDADGLIARTRKSMAGFEAARQQAQIDRQRSQRKSKAPPPQSPTKKDGGGYFPRVEEEEEAVGDASVMDKLLEAPQIDMESVFKSRPKMRTSPAHSPRSGMD